MAFINKVINWFIKMYNIVKNWALANKKAATIIAAAVVVVIAFVVLFFTVIKPSWDYSHKEVGETGYTQSQIDEIAEWWQSGQPQIGQEGNIDLEK